MTDWSVRNTNAGPQRNVDALLRATGGCAAEFLISPAQGDMTDAGQLGLDSPNLQSLIVAPAIFRRTRPFMQEGEPAKYELLISSSAIAQQVGLLNLESADSLFMIVVSIYVAGLRLLIEEWACSASLGTPVIYRLLLRTETPASLSKQG